MKPLVNKYIQKYNNIAKCTREMKCVHLKNNNYKPNEFAELINVSVKTLQRWDKEGILKAYRTPTDRRYYTYERYKEFKGISTTDKKTIIYTRVSTSNQKDDLRNQVEFLKQYANAKGIIVNDVNCFP